jgi:hypothetical protein
MWYSPNFLNKTNDQSCKKSQRRQKNISIRREYIVRVLKKVLYIVKLHLEVLVALFVWLISHQLAVLFSQNKPVTSNQPSVLFPGKNQHQPPAKQTS